MADCTSEGQISKCRTWLKVNQHQFTPLIIGNQKKSIVWPMSDLRFLSYRLEGQMSTHKSNVFFLYAGQTLKLIWFCSKLSKNVPLIKAFKNNSFVISSMLCYYGNKSPKVKSYWSLFGLTFDLLPGNNVLEIQQTILSLIHSYLRDILRPVWTNICFIYSYKTPYWTSSSIFTFLPVTQKLNLTHSLIK